MLNFYQRFVPQAARIHAPLHAALAGPKVKGSQLVYWTPTMLQAFEDCKASLSRAILLAHPDPSATLASGIGIGAALQQRVRDACQPLAVSSHKLSTTQQKYSPYDHELLAACESIKYFRHMVEGRPFVIFTDHKPLTMLSSNAELNDHHDSSVTCSLSDSSLFRHISGQDNVVADALSRANSIMTPLDYHALASCQDQDVELQDILQNGPALRLERVPIPEKDLNLHCDTSTPQQRPFITTPFRRQVFDTFHGLSHTRANATVQLASQWFVWPGVGKEWRAWTRVCTLPTFQGNVARKGVSTSGRHVFLIVISTWSGRCLSLRASGTVSLPSTDTRWPEGLSLSL